MKLTHLEIENFGKFSHYSTDFREGLNVLREDNGWGKSTLAVFVKAMLYGLPSTTKRMLDRNEREKYRPWQGGTYGGCLEFVCEKGAFRVERTFGAKESADTFQIYDLSTNYPTKVFTKNLGVELFGIDADGFERSTYLSQRVLEEGENDSVSQKLAGLLEDVNDIGNFDSAMNLLDNNRKRYELRGGKGKIADLSNQISETNRLLEEAMARLPQQKQLETNIAIEREEFRRNEERLKRIRQITGDIKEREAHLDERKRRNIILQEKEEERKKILNGFRGTVPTEEELQQASQWISECRETQRLSEAAIMQSEDVLRLEMLKKTYPDGFPAEEELNRMMQENERMKEQEILRSEQEKNLQPLSDRFRNVEPPTEEEINQAQEWLYRAETLRRQINSRTEADNREKRQISLAKAIPPLLLGILIAAISSSITGWFGVLLLVVGGLIGTTGAVLTFLHFVTARRTDPAELRYRNELAQEQERNFALVRNFLQPYDIMREGVDLHRTLNDLSLLAQGAREARKIRTVQENRVHQTVNNITECQSILTAFLERYGITALPGEYKDCLQKIAADKQDFTVLTSREERYHRFSDNYAEKIADLQSKVQIFMNRYTPLLDRNPEECLKKMSYLCSEHARLLGEIRKENHSLAEFSAINRLDDPNTEIIPAQLLEEEDLLNANQEELRNSIDADKRELDGVCEKTCRINELTDRLQYYKLEKETAEKNLSILQSTQQLLQDAKLSLSTRYLAGMQKNFAEYATLLGKEKIGSPKITAGLEISVSENSSTHPLEAYSSGWRDLLQFCARLALVDSMFKEGEQPFLLLDDPFVNLDNEKLDTAKELLEKLSSSFQIFHFVCHTDRM